MGNDVTCTSTPKQQTSNDTFSNIRVSVSRWLYQQVVKEIRQKSCIAAAHRRFNCLRQWRQCDPVQYMLPLAQSSPQPKRISIGSATFAQLMAECCRACPFD